MATRPLTATATAPSQESTPEPLSLAGRIAGEHVDELPALSEDIADRILAEMPELGDGDDLREQVRATVEANLMTIFWMLTQGVPADRAEAPAAAVELVRETVRNGGDLSGQQRMYRVGQARFASWWIGRLTERIDDARLLARIVDSSNTFVFEYMDHVLLRLGEEYVQERERWVRSSAAVRAEVVGAILAGQEVDIDTASTRLGHELRRHHLGVVVWTESDPENDQVVPGLERVAAALSDALGCSRPLLVPAGASVLWAWISAHEKISGEELTRAHRGLKGAAKTWVATGTWDEGLDGLRRSHADALQARHVARAAQRAAGSLTRFDEVAVAALLGDDTDRARRFVHETLGPLASGDEPTTRLRETLAAFLEAGSSHVAAARRLHVHQNTVAYRVRRAEDLLGAAVADRRLNLEIALALASALGPAVLEGRSA